MITPTINDVTEDDVLVEVLAVYETVKEKVGEQYKRIMFMPASHWINLE